MSAPCQWESLLHVEFLICQCDHDDPGHQQSACDHCPLCLAQYTAGQAHQTIPLAPCQLIFSPALLNVETTFSVFKTDRVEIRKHPPPELPSSWQFSSRSALLPRAPSLLA